MRIFAVDDDPIILEFIEAVIDHAASPEVKLTVARSGPEALDTLAASKSPFDCFLLDIDMPEMDGITLCRRIRSLEAYKYKPILMLTQRSDPFAIEQAFVAGATDYVTKPFDIKNLQTRLRIAGRMVEKTNAAPRLSPEVMKKKGLPGVHPFGWEDPVYIEGIKQLILPFPLGNYLSQLSRTELDSCQVFAAKIENLETLYAEGSTREVAIAIISAVTAISKVIDRPKLLMSHHGGGILLCVSTGVDLPIWPEIEGMAQDALAEIDVRYDNGHKMQVELSIGRPIPPNASATQRVKQTFDRATSRLKRQLGLAKAEELPVSAAY